MAYFLIFPLIQACMCQLWPFEDVYGSRCMVKMFSCFLVVCQDQHYRWIMNLQAQLLRVSTLDSSKRLPSFTALSGLNQNVEDQD